MPSLCSFCILNHYTLSFFFHPFWSTQQRQTEQWWKSSVYTVKKWWVYMMRLAVPAVEMREALSDRRTENSGVRPPCSRRAGETHWVFTTSWSETLRVLAHNLFSRRLFLGVFICSTSCLSHLSVNPEIRDLLQNYVACLSVHFSLF